MKNSTSSFPSFPSIIFLLKKYLTLYFKGESEPSEAHAFVPSTSDDSFDDDPEFCELQEREQIVDKYERVCLKLIFLLLT